LTSPEQALVRLGGKETLIDSKDLKTFVVEQTLSDPKLAERFDVSALLRFAEQSMRIEEPAWAGLAFRTLRWRANLIEDDLLESIDVISEGSSLRPGMATLGQVSLIPVFEPERFPRLTAWLVLAAAGGDPAWIREHGIAYAYGAERAIKERIQREFSERLQQRDISGVEPYIAFAREVYGKDDPVAQALALRFERYKDVLKAVDDGDIEALGSSLAVETPDRELSALIGPLAMEGLHAAASRAIEGGDSSRALEILARVDTLRRTQVTVDLTLQALAGLAPREVSILQRAEVLNYLDFMARYDGALAESYQLKLLEQISFLLEKSRVRESEALLERARNLGGGAQEIFASIPLRQAQQYFRQGLHGLAEKKLRESGAQGFGAQVLRFRLAIAESSLGVVIGFLTAALLLIALIVVSIQNSRRRGSVTAGAGAPLRGKSTGGGGPQEEAARSVEDTEEDAPRGFVVNELRRLSPSTREYHRCLDALGLTPEADLRSIKNAYRKAVKSVHPDRNKSQDEAASSRFIELTRVYDRILELRREFGYED
jgi:hypothetical protein